MKKKEPVLPGVPKRKTLTQVMVQRTLTELVRGNLLALQTDRIDAAKIHNGMIDEYEHWMQTGKYIGEYRFTKGLLDGVERQDVMRWTVDRMSKSTGISVAVLRKIFDDPEPTQSTKKPSGKPVGLGLLRVDEVIPLAVFFGVTPGYLLQPFREDLENYSLLKIGGFGKQDFVVNAHDWFSWVHGFLSLPMQGSATIEERLTYLSASQETKRLKPHQVNTKDALPRFLASAYGSEVNATIVANIQYTPFTSNPPREPHPLNDAVRKKTQVERIRWRLRKQFSYMTNVRRALRLVGQLDTPDELKRAIDWSVEMMREDLSAIAANREDVGPKK